MSNKKGGANAPHRLLWLILPHYVVWVKHLVLSGIQNKSRWPGQTGIEKREILCRHFSGLGPIYSNRIMFAHDLCAGRLWPLKSASAKDWRFSIEGMLSIRIKKTERSDTTNRHSSFVNHQFGYGFAGLGSGKRLGSLINFPILPVFGTSSKLLISLKIPSDSSAIFHKHQLPSLE